MRRSLLNHDGPGRPGRGGLGKASSRDSARRGLLYNMATRRGSADGVDHRLDLVSCVAELAIVSSRALPTKKLEAKLLGFLTVSTAVGGGFGFRLGLGLWLRSRSFRLRFPRGLNYYTGSLAGLLNALVIVIVLAIWPVALAIITLRIANLLFWL